MSTASLELLVQKCRKDMDALISALHTSDNEEQWTRLLNDIQVRLKESRWGVLYVLKFVVLNLESVGALKNLMQIYIMKLSDMISENKALETEPLATECLALLKDFWALCSSHHHGLTNQMFGKYSSELYDVLPSMASLYIDLFVAANRSKEKKEMLSKRLYGWLNMNLNERCLKTSLLEVSKCTTKTAAFLLPILRKILLSPPPKKSSLDYLLHFVLLRRWALVCKDVADVVQINLNVKAPKNFVDWLCQRWDQAREHIPLDKSLKGRRVSEFLCGLDEEAVDGLIDVFSQCLMSGEEQDREIATPGAVADLFVIDKKGNEQDGPPSKKRRKVDESSMDIHTQSNGTGSTESSKAVKTQSNNKTKDAEATEDFHLGFVVDRTAVKADVRKGKVESENTREEREALKVDEDKDRESDDADSIDDGADPESDNEDVESDEDQVGSNNKEDADGDSSSNEVNDDENVESNNKEDADGDSSSNEVNDDENVESNNEEDSDGDSSSNEVDNDDSDENSDDDDDEEGEDNGDNATDAGDESRTDRNSSTKSLASTSLDPALSYFVDTKHSEDSEIEVIDGMEIQTFESIESESKTRAKQLAPGASDHESNRKRKRGSSESEKLSADSTPQRLNDSEIESSDRGTSKKQKRSRTESGSSANGRESKHAASSDETPRFRKISKSSREEDDVKQSPSKESPARTKQLSESSLTPIQTSETKNKSQKNTKTYEIAEDVEHTNQRRRSKSESSMGKSPVSSSPERLHNTRRSKQTSESSVHDQQGQRVDITKQKNEKKGPKDSSPQKKSDEGAESPREKTGPKVESPKKKLGVDSVRPEVTPLSEGQMNALGTTEKKQSVTEEQVGLVLSQIRKISLKSDVSNSPTRSSTRLRTKSEGSETQVNVTPKSGRNGRRQNLTGIKAKVDTSTSSQNTSGSANVLADWLRMTPAKSKEESRNSGKVATDVHSDSLLLSSDGEITFKKTPKTYSSSATKRGRSPKRILIESKSETSNSPDSDRSKSPQKNLKSDTSPSKEKLKGDLSSGNERKGRTPASKKTPKSLTVVDKSEEDEVADQVILQIKKTPASSSQPRRRKYHLRGTSPVKSPTAETEKSVAQKTPVASLSGASNSPALQRSPRKSPAERRKSLRSSSKKQ